MRLRKPKQKKKGNIEEVVEIVNKILNFDENSDYSKFKKMLKKFETSPERRQFVKYLSWCCGVFHTLGLEGIIKNNIESAREYAALIDKQ